MLPRLRAVIRREYLERVRTKAFWISTVLVPIFMAGVMIIPTWLAARGAGSFTVAVMDLSGHLGDQVRTRVGELVGKGDRLKITLEAVEPGPDPQQDREELKKEVLAKRYDGVLILPATLPAEGAPEYLAPNVAAFRLLSVLERAVNDVVVAQRLTGQGLDPEVVRDLTRRVDLKTLKLGAKGEETRDKGQAFLLSYVLMLVIYMSVLMYGIYVMRGVLEEKQSRIVEVVLGAVKPFELMLGKLLGIGAVGLTQFLLWTVVGLALAAPGTATALGFSGMELPHLPVSLMIFFVVFFVLGFLLYGTLYAAIGAAFDTEQDAQQFQTVVTMFLVIPIILMVQIMNQPEGGLAVGLSLVPFFAPMLMFLRMTLTTVPVTQIAACLGLMVLAILGCTWIAAKIYRIGILMSGSKPKAKDLIRWLREA